MKKRLICLLLILIVAFSFSFSACNVFGNQPPKGDETGTVGDGTQNGAPNDEKEPNDDGSEVVSPDDNWKERWEEYWEEYRKENSIKPDFESGSDYAGADYGEKGYVEYMYEYGSSSEANDALITSLDELKEYCESSRIWEMYLSRRNTGDTEISKLSDRLSLYSDKYFENNALIIIFAAAGSGSHWYTVKNIETSENVVNVTIQRWETIMGTCDMKYWGIIIECPKSDVDELKVVTEVKEQQCKPSSVEIHLALTHEVSLQTIFRDYTAEDFPELDFDFVVEDSSGYYKECRENVQQLLLEGSLSSRAVEIYTRKLLIKLTVESAENVLRAVELLSKRADINWVEPDYVYYFDVD